MKGVQYLVKNSFMTDVETVWATITPQTRNNNLGNKTDKGTIDLTSLDYSNIPKSADNTFSHIFNNSGKNSIRRVSEVSIQEQMSKELKKWKEQIHSSSMYHHSKKTQSWASNSEVFSRLHTHAVKRQQAKVEKSVRKSTKYDDKKSVLKSSKSSKNLSKPWKTTFARTKSTKEIRYDANAGHRLYAKSRGQSTKREKSLRTMRRHKSVAEKKFSESLNQTSLMSSKSKWILNEREYGRMYATDSNWNKKDILNEVRYYDRSVNEYLQQKVYEQQVVWTFNPNISKNSKEIASRKRNVSYFHAQLLFRDLRV